MGGARFSLSRLLGLEFVKFCKTKACRKKQNTILVDSAKARGNWTKHAQTFRFSALFFG